MNRIIITLIVVNIAAIAAVTEFVPVERTAVATTQSEMPVFVQRMMQHCSAQLSEARREVLSRQLARIASGSFISREHQEAFILLVCIESKFQSNARSKAGAVGLSQLLPKYASEFSALCGLGPVTADDLLDSELNLTVGACQFRKLLDSFEGNVGLALAAYNAGQFSDTAKKAAALQSINPETANYLSKFLVLQQRSSK
jgi:hypothetical protein